MALASLINTIISQPVTSLSTEVVTAFSTLTINSDIPVAAPTAQTLTVTATPPGQMGQAISTTAAGRSCNGSPLLCDRTYDNVTYLGAHNAPIVQSLIPAAYAAMADQAWSWEQQLDNGVRLFSAEFFTNNGEVGADCVRVCHSYCQFTDVSSLSTWLTFIKNWLDKHPNNVITIMLINPPTGGLTWTGLGQIYQGMGMDVMSYRPQTAQTPPTKWPTLAQLIDAGTPVLTFIDNIADGPSETPGCAPYIMKESNFFFSTEWLITDPNAFNDCKIGTGDSGSDPSLTNYATALQKNMFPALNHVLYWQPSLPFFPSATVPIYTSFQAMAAQVNGDTTAGSGNLQDHVNACASKWNRYPTFVFCDFVDQGSAMNVVNMMNGLGRPSIPAPPKTCTDSKTNCTATTSAILSKSSQSTLTVFANATGSAVRVIAESAQAIKSKSSSSLQSLLQIDLVGFFGLFAVVFLFI